MVRRQRAALRSRQPPHQCGPAHDSRPVSDVSAHTAGVRPKSDRKAFEVPQNGRAERLEKLIPGIPPITQIGVDPWERHVAAIAFQNLECLPKHAFPLAQRLVGLMHPRIRERGVNSPQGISAGEAQPEFIVEGEREVRIETPSVFKRMTPQKACGLANETLLSGRARSKAWTG